MKLLQQFVHVVRRVRDTKRSRFSSPNARVLGAGFMRLEDRLVLSAVGLGNGLLNEVSAAATVQVEVQTPLVSAKMDAAVESAASGSASPASRPVTANVGHAVDVLEAVDSSRENRASLSLHHVTDLTPSIARGVGRVVSQVAPHDRPANVRRPVAAVKDAVPVVRGDDPVDDFTNLPDSDVNIPDDETTLPPDLPDPELPPPPLDPGGYEAPGEESSTAGGSRVNNPSTFPNGSGTQDLQNVPSGPVASAGSLSPRWWYESLSFDFAGFDKSHNSEFGPDLETGRHTQRQSMVESSALDAALAELYGVKDLEKEGGISAGQVEIVDKTTTDVPQDDANLSGAGNDNADDVALSLLGLAGKLAPGLSQGLLQMAVGIDTGDIALALKALENLLGGLENLGEEAGLWTQAGFAVCLLSTVAAAGGGFEITRRQMKHDRKRAGGDGRDEDEALPPDMFPVPSLS